MNDKEYFDLMQRAQRGRKLLNGKYADPASNQVKKLTKHIDQLAKQLVDAKTALKRDSAGAKYFSLKDEKSEMQQLRNHYRKQQISVNVDVCRENVKLYVKEFNRRHTAKITVESYMEADT